MLPITKIATGVPPAETVNISLIFTCNNCENAKTR